MANPEHVEILKQGVEVWNKWREKNPEITPDLSQAHLHETDLYGARLDWVRFDGADLNGSDLRETDLRATGLNTANLSEANLMWADLSGANLSKAILCRANLVWVKFHLTKCDSCDFTDAELGGTSFASVDLSDTVGLESTESLTPSTIGIDTIYKSKGKISEAFLRGCGVPEDFITRIPSLTFQTNQYSSCFISHSSHNQLFCKQLCTDLRSREVDCWYFPEDARWGRSVWGEIDKPIQTYDKLILVCSKQSLNSPAVLRELERALQREDTEGKHILFPIRIDNYLFDEWEHPRKADVVSTVAGDFRNWQDPTMYQEKFDRLLRNLKASEK